MNDVSFNVAPSVISLQCYVCNSNVDESCADGSVLNKFIRTCNETIEPYCRKIDQTGRRNQKNRNFDIFVFS